MKNIAVIYKSNYGSTETYAKWIADDLDADLLQADKVNPSDLQKYQTIIYGGGIYAGGVNGVSLLIKNFELIKDKNLYLFTVSASDTADPEIIKAIVNALEQKLTPSILEKIRLYHLRGGLFYSKMSFLHRTMMKMMVKMMRKKAENELANWERGLLETYGDDADFADRKTIIPLVESVKYL